PVPNLSPHDRNGNIIDVPKSYLPWLGMGFNDEFRAEVYDPFHGGQKEYTHLKTVNFQISFHLKSPDKDLSFDQDELGEAFRATIRNHILAPGQPVALEYGGYQFRLNVTSVELTTLTMEKASSVEVSNDPADRGIVYDQTIFNFFAGGT